MPGPREVQVNFRVGSLESAIPIVQARDPMPSENYGERNLRNGIPHINVCNPAVLQLNRFWRELLISSKTSAQRNVIPLSSKRYLENKDFVSLTYGQRGFPLEYEGTEEFDGSFYFNFDIDTLRFAPRTKPQNVEDELDARFSGWREMTKFICSVERCDMLRVKRLILYEEPTSCTHWTVAMSYAFGLVSVTVLFSSVEELGTIRVEYVERARVEIFNILKRVGSNRVSPTWNYELW